MPFSLVKCCCTECKQEEDAGIAHFHPSYVDLLLHKRILKDYFQMIIWISTGNPFSALVGPPIFLALTPLLANLVSMFLQQRRKRRETGY